MTQHECTKYDPLGRMTWQEKHDDMCKRMEEIKLAAVAMLDPSKHDTCKEALESIGANIKSGILEICNLQRCFIYNEAHDRVEAANPTTRDFSLEGLPDDTPLDVDEQFNKWVKRNQALSEDCKQKLINRQPIDMGNIVFHGSWPWK